MQSRVIMGSFDSTFLQLPYPISKQNEHHTIADHACATKD